MSELLLGLRLAFSGGRSAWLRTLLTAVGIGLGVAVLLGAASVPTMFAKTQDRNTARTPFFGDQLARTDRTLLVRSADTTYRADNLRGRDLRAEGAQPVLPPGVRSVPAPGTMVVSPALAELLDDPRGSLLRERLDARVVGTIGEAGLLGPSELLFYRGSAGLTGTGSGGGERIARFGDPGPDENLGVLITLLVAIAVVVLLLPVAIFVAGAVRFGSEDRDRRLAALRLIGADRAMAIRVAAGEALAGAFTGVLLGCLLYIAGRPLARVVSLQGLSFFPADVTPGRLLAVLILVGVPAATVLASLGGMCRVIVEPLGVVRRSVARRRRVLWRLGPALVGLALLLSVGDGLDGGDDGPVYRAAAGVLLALGGLTVVVPWLVEVVGRRVGGRGPLSLQLATRRLQADGGTAARVVGGIAVTVAGAIALQSLFAAAVRESTEPGNGGSRQADVQLTVSGVPGRTPTTPLATALSATEGVRTAVTFSTISAQVEGRRDDYPQLVVGSCAALRGYAGVPSCEDGDSFLAANPGGPELARRGDRLLLGDEGGPARWTVPTRARSFRVPPGIPQVAGQTVLATPGALRGVTLPSRVIQSDITTDPTDPDALERVRSIAFAQPQPAFVLELSNVRVDPAFAQVRRALFAGASAILLLIGASLLVGALEQLRERRRIIAVLVAFGTPRSTLAASVLWQAAIPMALGLAVAAVVGGALGAILLRLASQPVVVDWAGLSAFVGAGAAVALLVALLSLPALRRGMRPDGLRTE